MILDDATREIYYAQLVKEESTATVMTALREVIERKGAFCALYGDRASHFLVTRAAGLSTVLRDAGTMVMFAGTPYAHLHICGSPWKGNEYRRGDRAVRTMRYEHQ